VAHAQASDGPRQAPIGSAHVPAPPAARPAKALGVTPGRTDRLALVAIWAVASAYNLFKPYHIDDAAYLEIARWIQAHPLHPMSGLLNWSGSVEPIWKINQPALWFYVMAAWAGMFGFAEPTMHALQSLAALACVFLLHRLARRVAPGAALWVTAIVILGPAFVVEQNVMTDTPLLATWLAVFNLLIVDADNPRQTQRFVLAGLACAAAVLIKYSSLALLPVIGMALAAERRAAQAWTLLIPLAAVGAWSLFNLYDYGGVHIAMRGQTFDLRRSLDLLEAWLIGLGAVAPLGMVQIATWLGARLARLLCVVWVGWLAGLAIAVAIGLISDRAADRVLWIAFAANAGLIVVGLAVAAAPLLVRPMGWIAPLTAERAPVVYLLLWIAAATAFYGLFAPFMAIRHVLTIVPAVTLLLAHRWGARLRAEAKGVSFGLIAVVSAGLCLSDWRFAAFARDETARVARETAPGELAWFNAHWGWQWYGRLQGLRQYNPASGPRPGDWMLVAVSGAVPDPPVRLGRPRTDVQPRQWLSLFCTGREVRLYAFDSSKPPWSLSRNCVNQAQVFRVVPPAG